MRDCYSETFTWNDPSMGQALKPLNGALVTVYLAGTLSKATLYAARDPSNSTQVQNPFTTNVSGLAEFWVVAGEYDIKIEDQGGLSRISTKTFGWNSTPAAPGSIPAATLKGDAGLSWMALSSDITKQAIQIGQVISWWRPSAAVPLPAGFVVCDGQVVAAGAHDFIGFSGAFNTPDLRNKFILGADQATAYGTTVAAPADESTSSPGINGVGGSNVRNISHTHGHEHTHNLSNHTHAHEHTHSHDHVHNVAHTHTLSAHVHGMGNHTHYVDHTHTHYHAHYTNTPDHLHGGVSFSVWSGAANRGTPSHPTNSGGGEGAAYTNHGHTITGSSSATGASDRALGAWSGNPDNAATGTMNGRTATDGPNTNQTGAPITTGGASNDVTGAASITNSGGPIGSGGGALLNTSGASVVNTAGPSTNNSGGASNTTTDAGGTTALDNRPQYIGLLMLMKVKRVTAY